jgi:hypothetical protein
MACRQCRNDCILNAQSFETAGPRRAKGSE